MIGYVVNARLGAIAYNTVHTYVGPLLLAAYAFGLGHQRLLWPSLIWIAHIGLDRTLGFGLKYPTQFKDTHLNPDRHALGPFSSSVAHGRYESRAGVGSKRREKSGFR